MTDCRCGDCKWWARAPGLEVLEWRRCCAPIPKWAASAVLSDDADDERNVDDSAYCETFAALDKEASHE